METPKDDSSNVPPLALSQEANFIASWKIMQEQAYRITKSKGWCERERTDAELLCLVHSEVSEAVEALRHGNGPSDHIPAYSGMEEELADVVIRIMSMAGEKGWRVALALADKMNFNRTRPKMHGGKLF
jgi:NTP pyrophosphatase (non-canonical NTP hydrolase)